MPNQKKLLNRKAEDEDDLKPKNKGIAFVQSLKRAGTPIYSQSEVMGDKEYCMSLWILPPGRKYTSRIVFIMEKKIHGSVVGAENTWFELENVVSQGNMRGIAFTLLALVELITGDRLDYDRFITMHKNRIGEIIRAKSPKTT